MRNGKLGIGIIGLGGISFAHEAGYSEIPDQCEIVAMCDINASTVKDRAQPYGAETYTDFHQLNRNPGVDIVDIILPHHLHTEVALDAFDQGKHVTIEKPITLLPADALCMIAKAKEKNVKFTVAENTRFVTAYREAEKIIQSGELGDIILVKTVIAGSEVGRILVPDLWKGKPWGSGGGVIMDCGPHSFYLIKWLFGKVKELQAVQSFITPGCEVEDYANVTGKLANGAVFHTSFSFITQAPWTERLEIHGTKKTIIIDQLTNPVAILYNGTEDYDGQKLDVPYEPAGWKYLSIVDEVKDFVRVVQTNGIPAVDPLDCHYGLTVIETAYESVKTGTRLSVPD
jgi:predicted dehydrogenase